MAVRNKGPRSKKPREPVPTDDPTIFAQWERVGPTLDAALRPPFTQWIGSNTSGLVRASTWLRAAVAQQPWSDRALELMLDLLPMLDDERALDALWCVGFWLTGEHRNWLNQPRFDAGELYRDGARSRCRDAVVAKLDAILAAASDRYDVVRARALFVLGWLGEAERARALPVLRARCADPDAVVRAAAVVALAMHGERIGALGDDEDARVRLCATIAESWIEATDEVRASLRAAIDGEDVQWPQLPFNDGAIRAWAIIRYGVAARAQPAQLEAALLEVLRGPSAEQSVGAVIAAAFIGYGAGAEPTATQRAVVRAVVHREALYAAAIAPLQAARLIPVGGYETIDVSIDGLRARFGIERPPPSFGSLERVTVRDRSTYAQHWMAEFAVAPEPDLAAEIADQIARTLTIDALLELTLMRSIDVDGTNLPYDRVRAAAYPVALPNGTVERDGRLVHGPERWPEDHRRWCADRASEGWLMVGSWWSGEEVITRWFDLRGRWLEVFFGHEWNGGNPIRSEARVVVNARHRLTPLVLRAARARAPQALDAAMRSLVDAPNGGQHSWRVVQAAIELFSASDEAPPAWLDAQALALQRSWAYVTAVIAPYARLLPTERREALAIAMATQSSYALPLLYELAPSERTLDAILPAIRQSIRNWPDYVTRSRALWERALGLDAAERIVAACGPSPEPRATSRR